MPFSELGLSTPILDAISNQGYSKPSPIQAEAIPAVLAGRDVMAAAQTGTGKTAGFTLPLLEKLSKGEKARSNRARALVVTPTRELAAQVGESVRTYGENLSLTSAVVFGGVKINPQMMRLRRGADILVATPGRLLDLYNQKAIKFDDLEVLVLDEADRMLDMGFIHDIKKILKILPKNRQNLLFSATFSEDIRALAKGLINDPVEISVSPRNAAAKTVKQAVFTTDKKRKAALLTHLIKKHNWQQALVFTKTKRGANQLTKHLEEKGITAAPIHGNKSQGARTRALNDFKSGSVRILVATDIAARGIDIDQLPQVVNFDLPNVSEDYVHRIGRTGRAGAEGQAVSLVAADEVDLLRDIERLIQKVIPRQEEDGFEAMHVVPESRQPLPPKKKKPKKPKKPSSGRNGHSANGKASGAAKQGNGNNGQAKRRKPNAQKNTAGSSENSTKKPYRGARRKAPPKLA